MALNSWIKEPLKITHILPARQGVDGDSLTQFRYSSSTFILSNPPFHIVQDHAGWDSYAKLTQICASRDAIRRDSRLAGRKHLGLTLGEVRARQELRFGIVEPRDVTDAEA